MSSLAPLHTPNAPWPILTPDPRSSVALQPAPPAAGLFEPQTHPAHSHITHPISTSSTRTRKHSTVRASRVLGGLCVSGCSDLCGAGGGIGCPQLLVSLCHTVTQPGEVARHRACMRGSHQNRGATRTQAQRHDVQAAACVDANTSLVSFSDVTFCCQMFSLAGTQEHNARSHTSGGV